MDDVYTAETNMYVMVNQQNDGQGAAASSSLQSDLNSSQMITNDVADLVTSKKVTRGAARALGLDNLDDFSVSVSYDDSSRVIGLTVSGADAEEAVDVANGLAENVSSVAREVMGVESVNIIDEAELPEGPSGPNRPLYVIVAGLNGMLLSAMLIIILDFFNSRIRSEEALEEITGLPIMGRVPLLKNGGGFRG